MSFFVGIQSGSVFTENFEKGRMGDRFLNKILLPKLADLYDLDPAVDWSARRRLLQEKRKGFAKRLM
jgi:hypothetical protein